jgi:hypothetical protein
MTYVLIAAMPDGALQDTAGNARLDPVEFRLVNGTAPNHYDGTLVSHYADAAGTGPSTAAITPDSRGRLMRYIAGGYYKQIVNPAEPTRRESLDFHAFSGSDAPYTLEAAGVTVYPTAAAADVGTDATALLNTAAATARANGRQLTSAKGGFVKVTSTFDFANIDLDLSNLTLRVDFAYPLGSETAAIRGWEQISPFRVKQRTLKLPRVENADAYPGGATNARWVTAAASVNDIGVQLVNCEHCEIDVPAIEGFSVGLDEQGRDASGFVYNTVRLGRIQHNRISHRLGQQNSTGWCNSNTHIGGGYNHYDAQTGIRMAGVRHVSIPLIDASATQNTDNHWIGVSFEGQGAEYEVDSYGVASLFAGCRWEKTGSTPRVIFRDGTTVNASDNVISQGYNTHNVGITNDPNCSRNYIFQRDGIRATSGVTVPTQKLLDLDAQVFLRRLVSGTAIFYLGVSSEAVARFQALSDGAFQWGDGTNAPDLVLRRWVANVARFDTDDALAMGSGVGSGGSFIQFWEQSADPVSGGADSVRIYPKDLSGKTMLYRRDNSRVELLPGSLTNTATWDPPSVAAGAQTTTTITVTGAALGDIVGVGFDKDLQAMQLTGHVSSADTVTVVLRNGTAGAIDLASGTLRATVTKYT